MTQNNSMLTGGCQCGAVRFMAERVGSSSVCHCRMCQKAFGSVFGALASTYGLVWTRGAPKYFQSSNKVRRGFCGDCGTPLTYEALGRSPEQEIEVAVGTFDHPGIAAPTVQVNLRDRQPVFEHLSSLPVRMGAAAARHDAHNATIVSHQHPDHDTAAWPPKEGFPA